MNRVPQALLCAAPSNPDILVIPYHRRDADHVGRVIAHHLFRLGYRGRGKAVISPDGEKETVIAAIRKHVRLIRKSGKETLPSDAVVASVYAWSNTVGLL